MRPLLILSAVLLAAPSNAPAQQVNPEYYSGMSWRSIGPNRSGYIAAVAGIPGDPTTYYIGLPEGGVWKTTNGGITWKPIFDAVHVASIGAIAVAPSNPNVIYVGTGEQSGWSFTSGHGVYKSTDAGKTWTNIGLGTARYINAIIVDPRNPDIVLAAAQNGFGGDTGTNAPGVYRSTDGGRIWAHMHVGVGDVAAFQLSYDFADPEIIYATMQWPDDSAVAAAPADARALPPIPVYRSGDGGATWNRIKGAGLDTTGGHIAVASGTHGRRLYAFTVDYTDGHATVVRSEDGGDSWTLGTRQIASASGNIYADPKNPDVVYLMGTSMYRSTDGGRHFESYMGAPSGDDIRQLWIDPTNPRRMIAGADQGPTISVDGGETWSLWDHLPNGQFYNVSTDNDFPYHVCGAQQDSGTACVLSRSDFGEIRPNDWAPIGGFEASSIITDPLNSRWVYTQGWYNVLRRFDRKTGQVVVLYTPTPEDHFAWLPPMALSPQDPHTLYMGAQHVLVSHDDARHWQRISPDLAVRATRKDSAAARLGRGGTLATVAPSPLGAGELWTGSSNGLVQLTRDGGKTWHNVTPVGATAGTVNSIEPSRARAGTAYVTMLSRGDHPHIYRTSDFGQHWHDVATGLPDGAVVRVVREDPVDPDLLYAGTVTGAWVSFDRGDHWQSLQLNLPTTVVSDMTVHGSDLVISTYGRGFWILDDVTALRQARTAMAASSLAFLFQPDTASRIRWDNTQDTPLQVEVQAGQNPPEGAIIDYYLNPHATGPVTLSISDAAGKLIREFPTTLPPPDTLMANVPAYWIRPPLVLSTTPGMHRINWDLRYPDPPSLPFSFYGQLLDYTEYTLMWHAFPGRTPQVQPPGPLVLPGRYLVTLTVGAQRFTRSLIVVADPRVGVPAAALAAQSRLMQRMVNGLHASADGFSQAQRLHTALASIPAPAAGKAASIEAAAAAAKLDTAITALGTGYPSFGGVNRNLARQLTDMEYGDVEPTESVLTAAALSCSQLDAVIVTYRQLSTELNAMLVHAGMPALSAWTAPTSPACGGGR